MKWTCSEIGLSQGLLSDYRKALLIEVLGGSQLFPCWMTVVGVDSPEVATHLQQLGYTSVNIQMTAYCSNFYSFNL
jgi:hypothetical protein